MINIPTKTKAAYDRNSIHSINSSFAQGALSAQNITSINNKPNHSATIGNAAPINNSVQTSQNSSTHTVQPSRQVIPNLTNAVQKGQKVSLFQANSSLKLKAYFGWNTTNAQCDVDVSAFMLGEDGKVLGDSWFVFYSQLASPDNSITLSLNEPQDRESIVIDFTKINPNVKKIVFVLTINDALENNLHFGMMQDAYIRILNSATQSELVSFKMTDYYNNVISMMIGEIYYHNGNWKFNAVGNGVARDLAGLCNLYGVEII